MTLQELYENLLALNEEEQFYRRYYEARSNPQEWERFVCELDREDICKRHLIVTEVDTGFLPQDMDDDIYFDESDKNSIVLSKHNRYTPVFLHKHRFFELVYVLEGVCAQEVEGEAFELSQGEFLLIAPDTRHSIGVFDSSIVINILIRRGTFEEIFYDMLRGTDMISLFFNQSLFSKKKNHYLILNTKEDAELREQVLSMFVEYLAKERYYEKVLSSQLFILFSKILRRYENQIRYPSTMWKRDENSMRMLGYIRDHSATVTLSQMAQHFHFSCSYCSRIIKACTGHSFTEQVQKIRLERACELLRTSDIAISEIAHLVGFEHTEHFNRSFKAKFGKTPGAYRKQCH